MSSGCEPGRGMSSTTCLTLPTRLTHTQYMLEVIGAGNPDYSGQDWADVWENSTKYKELMEDINRIVETRAVNTHQGNKNDDKEFAMPLWTQIMATTRRAFIAYWRTPEYALVSIPGVIEADL